MHYRTLFTAAFCTLLLSACDKNDNPSDTTAQVHFKCKIDPTQARLNNIGQPAPLMQGHAAQTPDFNQLSVHYIELAPTALTLLGKGAIVYKAAETMLGGENAVDFEKAAKAADGEFFATVKISDLPPGTYEWVRASVTYQNYDVRYNIRNIPVVGDLMQQSGTVASFVGFNTYLTTVIPRTQTLTVNDDKKQGFWAFESNLSAPYSAYNQLSSGQSPSGSTTVVNPLFASSPIPAGSCVVTGKLLQPLVITGTETADKTVVLAFSTNLSFEWIDTNGNGQLDFYADGVTPGEQIVDMGLRGLVPFVE